MAERGDGAERGGMEEMDDAKLEFTPTWIVAGVCSVIIFISLVAERYLHYLGKVPPFAPLPERSAVAKSANLSGSQEQESEATLQCPTEGERRCLST